MIKTKDRTSGTPTVPALSEAAYLVLASLSEGPTHGYEILGRADRLSGGRVHLAVATLYGALDRLVVRGQIELVREEVVDGRARRTYAITEDGIALLQAETDRMAQLVSSVTSSLGRRSGSSRNRRAAVVAG